MPKVRSRFVADHVFGWVIPLFGQSQDVHTWHHFGMWMIVIFCDPARLRGDP